MKKENRIRKNKEFKEVISKRKVVKSNEFVIYYSNNKLDKTRIGISVSSKLGNAVIRNRIKRQIRAILHEILDLKKNIDIVIVAKDGFKNNTYKQNFDALEKLINKIQ